MFREEATADHKVEEY